MKNNKYSSVIDNYYRKTKLLCSSFEYDRKKIVYHYDIISADIFLYYKVYWCGIFVNGSDLKIADEVVKKKKLPV